MVWGFFTSCRAEFAVGFWDVTVAGAENITVSQIF